jgi:hypothetical protein
MAVLGSVSVKINTMRSLTAKRRANRGRKGGEEDEREREKKKGEKVNRKKAPCTARRVRRPPQASLFSKGLFSNL